MKIANFDPTYGDLLGGAGAIIAGVAAGTSVFKPLAVVAATTTAGTLATSFEAGDAIDGVTLAEGDRILVKDQAAGAENGVYVVEATGAPTRAQDADSSPEIVGSLVVVIGGTVNAGTVWHNTNTSAITIGTTTVTFEAFPEASAANASMVPYFIASGDTFTVPIYKQALFSMEIDVVGALVVDGALLGVT
jgi:phage-related tail fiber protein